MKVLESHLAIILCLTGLLALANAQGTTSDVCLHSNCEQICVLNASLPAGYQCACEEGFVLDEDGFGCEDYDECESGRNNCTDRCINTQDEDNTDTTYECACFPGRLLEEDGFTCAAIVEDVRVSYSVHDTNSACNTAPSLSGVVELHSGGCQSFSTYGFSTFTFTAHHFVFTRYSASDCVTPVYSGQCELLQCCNIAATGSTPIYLNFNWTVTDFGSTTSAVPITYYDVAQLLYSNDSTCAEAIADPLEVTYISGDCYHEAELDVSRKYTFSGATLTVRNYPNTFCGPPESSFYTCLNNTCCNVHDNEFERFTWTVRTTTGATSSSSSSSSPSSSSTGDIGAASSHVPTIAAVAAVAGAALLLLA